MNHARGTAMRLAGYAAVAAAVAAAPCGAADRPAVVDPMRQVREISPTSFSVQYYTTEPCRTRVQVRRGTQPSRAWGRSQEDAAGLWFAPDAWIVEGPDEALTFHRIRVDGLEPAARYCYRFYDPAVAPTIDEQRWGAAAPWRREFSVSTLGGPGKKSIVRYPVKVLLMPNAIDVASAHDEEGAVIADHPGHLTREQLELIRGEYESASRFFWVNSGMRLWIDFQIFIDRRWQRWGPEVSGGDPFYAGWPECRSWDGVDYRDPGGGGFTIVDTTDLTRVRHEPFGEPEPYPGQIEQALLRRWDPGAHSWDFADSGGGTFGLDGVPDGFPGRSQFLGGGDTAWLAAHEFHHQLESASQFSLSWREDDRIVFNHPSPRAPADGETEAQPWTTSGPHGEQWDIMAYWDRTLTDAQWLRICFGQTLSVIDSDEDGFPDADPRLPLDELRFGSDPTRAATDGALGDLRKAMLSTWAPSVVQQSWGKPPFADARGAVLPNPAATDSDGDGDDDPLDPEPLIPFAPFIWPVSATPDGDGAEWTDVPPAGSLVRGDVSLLYKHAADDAGYHGFLLIDGPWERVRAVFDGEGSGVYSGQGVLGLEFLRTKDGARVEPVFEEVRALAWAAGETEDKQTILEFTLPQGGPGQWYWERGGRDIGTAIELEVAGGTVYSVYEPYHHFRARILESWGRAPMPDEPPPELTAEQADLVVGLGSAHLMFTGEGWRARDWRLTCQGETESAAYVEVLDTREFDLWVRMTAASDAVLAAATPGQESIDAGQGYVGYVGISGNTISGLRMFGDDSNACAVALSPGEHVVQMTRRRGAIWMLLDGEPVAWAIDPKPDAIVNRLGVIGGWNGDQILHEMRIRLRRGE